MAGRPVRRARDHLAVGGISQLFGLAARFVACGILGLVGTALIVRRQAG